MASSSSTPPLLDSLNLLLQAPSKAVVEKCLSLVFASRCDPKDECVSALMMTLGVTDRGQIEGLYSALEKCIFTTLATGSMKDLGNLFQESGGNVEEKLQIMVGSIIKGNLDTWNEASALNRVSLPCAFTY